MPGRTTLVYQCDCSFEGVLCCVYESYVRKELPIGILPDGEPTFYPVRRVETVEAHAARVWASLERLGGEVAAWALDGWASCAPGREEAVFAFVRLAYRHGAGVTSRLADPAVDALFRMVRAQRNEAHFFVEFARFSDYGGALVCVVSPKGLVLPHLGRHFADRFPEETFLIHDETHGQALFYRPYEWVVRPVEDLQLPEAGAEERLFRDLWKQYYDTIGIEGRLNPLCRRTHCPMRYWAHMTEMEGCDPRLAARGELRSAQPPLARGGSRPGNRLPAPPLRRLPGGPG